jgi:HK97 gp10 family phage protein
VAKFAELPAFEAGMQYATARYAKVVANAVRDDMEALCPVDTGELLASIKVEAVSDTAYVFVGTDHWIFPEYGTVNQRAQPYIRPALFRRRNVVELGGVAF